MKSHELAKILLEKPDVELILQKDEEGNGYTSCRGVDFDVIVTYEDYDYQIRDPEWDSEEADMSPEEWEKVKIDGAGFAILFP